MESILSSLQNIKLVIARWSDLNGVEIHEDADQHVEVHGCRTFLDKGPFGRILAKAPSLHKLAVAFNGYEFESYYYECPIDFQYLILDTHWPYLHTVKLDCIDAHENDWIKFFEQHAQTLRHLQFQALDEVHFDKDLLAFAPYQTWRLDPQGYNSRNDNSFQRNMTQWALEEFMAHVAYARSEMKRRTRRAPVLPVREYVIMQLVNTITDKSDWQRKVFDDAIIAKWKTEIDMLNALDDTPEAMAAVSSKDEWTSLASNESTSNTVGIDGTQQIIDHTRKHVNPKMFAWAIAEVKHKAIIFETINGVEALDGVWKSDTVIGQDLRKALEIAVQPLEAVPEVVAKAIPLWDRVLSHVITPPIEPRVSDWTNSNYGYGDGANEKPSLSDDEAQVEDEDQFEARFQAWKDTRPIIEPEPGKFRSKSERIRDPEKLARLIYPPAVESKEEMEQSRANQHSSQSRKDDIIPYVNLRKDYGQLQIIVKLANIHLSPENPEYPGGSWHVEGQANESM
ncbi:MAG: hypothetical protein Q9185_006922 [Variospora sp. 1 TL-2023]